MAYDYITAYISFRSMTTEYINVCQLSRQVRSAFHSDEGHRAYSPSLPSVALASYSMTINMFNV